MRELEIEVKQCSNMGLNLKSQKRSWIKFDAGNKINIGEISSISEEDVICDLTGKSCPLYDHGNGASYPEKINYDHLDRCPSSKDSTKRYKFKGLKEGHVLHVFEIERIEE